jgi:hypothetical protein
MSETSAVTAPIVKALNEAGYWAIRLNSGKVKVRGGWLNLCPPGTPDILVLLSGGRCLWVETKDVKKDYHKEQQESQGDFHARLEGLHHRVVVARCLDDVLAALEGRA